MDSIKISRFVFSEVYKKRHQGEQEMQYTFTPNRFLKPLGCIGNKKSSQLAALKIEDIFFSLL